MNCWKTRAIVLLFAICGSTAGLYASDLDGDGILDGNDVCCNTPQGTAVDATGRPIGDLDQDCDVDLLDFALLAANLTGPLAPPSCPSCFDQQQNGSETDLDCGGGICAPCASGFECLSASDCESRVCVAGVCQPPTCSDSVRNGFETGVDCGGNCLACPDGEGCDTGIDCVSLVCVNEECQPATCSDSVRNGFETGIDCGGTVCLACPDGEGCDTGSDCASLVCTSQVCQVPTCQDGVQNGSEQGVDCGGPCSPCGQPNGAPCGMPSQCSSNFCVDGRCCNSPCDGTCEACDLPGASGVCSLISVGEDPDNECNGQQVCDGGGVCKQDLGAPCGSPASCASGFCVDNVCCDSFCNGTCEACNVQGSVGVCDFIPDGQDPDDECGFPFNNCDGSGGCG
jgi:hypothetical protein